MTSLKGFPEAQIFLDPLVADLPLQLFLVLPPPHGAQPPEHELKCLVRTQWP